MVKLDHSDNQKTDSLWRSPTATLWGLLFCIGLFSGNCQENINYSDDFFKYLITFYIQFFIRWLVLTMYSVRHQQHILQTPNSASSGDNVKLHYRVTVSYTHSFDVLSNLFFYSFLIWFYDKIHLQVIICLISLYELSHYLPNFRLKFWITKIGQVSWVCHKRFIFYC